MTPFLHASCCAYKSFSLCYESLRRKDKSHKYVRDVDHMGYSTEFFFLFFENYNSFEKMNPIKDIWSPCQKCMNKFFDPYFDVLMNLVILRRHRKVYQNFIFNFEDIWKRKFVLYQTLNAFFDTGNLFQPDC